MTSPSPVEQLATQLKDVVSRVELLEKEVFHPPGSPSVATQLARLQKDLDDRGRRGAAESKALDEKIRETIRIVAELREIVSALSQRPQPG